MNSSIGKALREARLKKELSLEEAARVTKTRADRLRDLENDDYTAFPNLAYARGFIVLYAKFLGVDISRYQMIDPGNPVGLRDYQYLQSDPGLDVPIHPRRPLSPEKRSRWLLALGVLSGALLTAAVTVFLVLNMMRLGSIDELLGDGAASKTAGTAGTAGTTETTPAVIPEATPGAAPELPDPTPEPVFTGINGGEEGERDPLTDPLADPLSEEGTLELGPAGEESTGLLPSPDEETAASPETFSAPEEATPEPTPPPVVATPTPEPSPTATPRRVSRSRSTPAPTVRRATRPPATPTPGRRDRRSQ